MSMLRNRDARVDAYIERSAAFAQPILRCLRELVHRGCPDVQETMKWSRPFFVRGGQILCNMAAFRDHCSFGIWGEGAAPALERAGVLAEGAMGSFGRIRRCEDLPNDATMLALLAEVARPAERNEPSGRRVVKVRRPEIAVPAELAEALAREPEAAAQFAAMSPSCRREYNEWIAGAKRTETRERRLKEAVTYVSEGKPLHWRYQKS